MSKLNGSSTPQDHTHDMLRQGAVLDNVSAGPLLVMYTCTVKAKRSRWNWSEREKKTRKTWFWRITSEYITFRTCLCNAIGIACWVLPFRCCHFLCHFVSASSAGKEADRSNFISFIYATPLRRYAQYQEIPSSQQIGAPGKAGSFRATKSSTEAYNTSTVWQVYWYHLVSIIENIPELSLNNFEHV